MRCLVCASLTFLTLLSWFRSCIELFFEIYLNLLDPHNTFTLSSSGAKKWNRSKTKQTHQNHLAGLHCCDLLPHSIISRLCVWQFSKINDSQCRRWFMKLMKKICSHQNVRQAHCQQCRRQPLERLQLESFILRLVLAFSL